MKYSVKECFDEKTFTWSFIVYDEKTKDAVIIDPVLDYNPIGSEVSFESLEKTIGFIETHGLNLRYVIETHAHADHLSSSHYIKQKYPDVKVAIGSAITKVQGVFKDVFALGDDFKSDGSQFDVLLKEGEVYNAGSIEFKILETPGHTPACVSVLIDDAVFTGDALFLPDIGTGRCDFPEGSADDLYQSLQKLYALPDETTVYVGHDYPPAGERGPVSHCTMKEQKESNKQIKASTSKEDFVKFRTERDAVLKAPRLIFQSVQVNINAGELPSDNSSGYFKLPVNIRK